MHFSLLNLYLFKKNQKTVSLGKKNLRKENSEFKSHYLTGKNVSTQFLYIPMNCTL